MCSQSQEAMQFINVIYREANALHTSHGPPRVHFSAPLFSPYVSVRTYRIDRVLFYLFAERKKARTPSRVYACMRLAQVCNAGRNASCCSCFLADLSHTLCSQRFGFSVQALSDSNTRELKATPRARASRFDSS